MQTTRREFIKSTVGGTLAMTLAPALGHAASSKRIPIAFQLYTVRGEFSRDVPGTLKTLSQIGYKGVEFWGYTGTPEVYQKYSAKELRKMLDDNGLKCCGMHLELKALDDEHLQTTIKNNRVLGNKYLNVVMAPENMKSEAGIKELARLLNERADECKKHHMEIGYHSHAFDFEKLNGHFAWELLFRQTKPEVNMQIDVGNSLSGGGDPIAMLKEFPGRTPTIHIKEHEEKTFDSPFYQEVFHLCETTARTRWYIVEMGSPDGTGFDIPRQALAKLHQLGK